MAEETGERARTSMHTIGAMAPALSVSHPRVRCAGVSRSGAAVEPARTDSRHTAGRASVHLTAVGLNNAVERLVEIAKAGRGETS